MGTVYSGNYSTGSYTYTRVRVDYSGTSATAYLLHTRTNTWSGEENCYNGSFTFGGKSVTVNKAVAGKHTDTVIASVGFNISVSGGTYSGTSGPPPGKTFDSNPFRFSGSVTIPSQAFWNDINAYQPDGATQNGLIFDLTTSDGGSWTNLTNEPAAADFTKPSGTTATISNIRPNVAGAHYTTNNVTNDGSTSFTWTFNTADYAVKLYSAWDTYAITYNANGGTQSTCPATHYKTYNVTATIATQIPSRPTTETAGYTVTFDPGSGTAEYTTYSTINSTLYTFLRWNTQANGSGTNYNGNDNYTTNAALALYAQWSSTVVKGGVYFPVTTRANYDLVGWTRDPNNVSLVEEGYIPTQNETLHAVWSPIHTYMNVRTNDGWKTPVVNVKVNNVWTPTLHVNTDWSGESFTLGGTVYSLPYKNMTWRDWIYSSANTDGISFKRVYDTWYILVEDDLMGHLFVVQNMYSTNLGDLSEAIITPGGNYGIQNLSNFFPSKYTQVNYIENTTAGPGIDTKVVPTLNTIMDFSFRNLGVTGDVILGYGGIDTNDYRFFNYNSGIYFDMGSARINGSTCSANTDYHFLIGNLYVKNADTGTTLISGTTQTSFNPIGSIHISGGTGMTASKNRIYSLKIYEGNKLIRDFVPVLRNSDNAVGLLDMANSVFYSASGFTYG